MKRVLIVHYHFLPAHNVAVKRLSNYARHLPTFGWEPVFLTKRRNSIADEDPSWGLSWEPHLAQRLKLEIHRVAAPPPLPARRLPQASDPWLLRRILSLANVAWGDYPDSFLPWASAACDAAIELVRTRSIDVVVTYCPPETNLVVGSRLARALDVAWVPFFGDLWGFFLDSLPAISLEAAIRRARHLRWMKPAAWCATASPYMADYVTRTYNKPAGVILTGFDPEEFTAALPARAAREERLLISHVGSIYPGTMKPELFVEGLERFLRDHPRAEQTMEVRFVGSKCDDHLRSVVRGRLSERVCTILPKVDPATAVSMVRASDALLVLTPTRYRNRHGTMSHPTKIFEAFGARRPILAVPPDRDWIDRLLAYTGAGSTAGTPMEIAAALAGWWSDWSRDGALPYHGRAEAIETLTLARQAERFAHLLDAAMAGTPPAAANLELPHHLYPTRAEGERVS